jgi:hypothetical protein
MAARRKESRFDFNLPRGWQDQTVYSFVGPEDSGVRHGVRMLVDRKLLQKDINSFAAVKAQPIRDMLQSVEILKDEETTVDGCHPSYEFVYKLMLSDTKAMIHACVMVIAEGMGFCFEARFTKRSYKTVGLQLRNVIEAVIPGTFEPLDED